MTCWRAGYPVLIYLLFFDLLAGIGIGPGMTRIGISGGLCIILLGPVYRREQRECLKVNYIATGMLAIAFWFAGNLLIAWSGGGSRQIAQISAAEREGPLWIQVAVIALIAPLAEEVVFRGLLFGRLRETLRFWPAAILSALLFAGFHGNIVQGIYAFGGGLLMAWSYDRYHSLKAPYCIHLISNLLSLLFSSLTMRAAGGLLL